MKLKPSQIVLFLLAMALTASVGASTQPAPEGSRKYYAVLVGVDGIEGKYENFEILKDDKRIRLNWGDLRTCVKDVLNLEESLKKHSPPEVEWEIHKFIEPNQAVEYDKPLGNYKSPNAFNVIEQTLAKIAVKARPGQVVLVYLSSHGWYDPKRDDLYFIVPGSNYEDPVTTCVSLKMLVKTIAYCEGDVIFMLDACDSGAGNEKGYAENDEEYFDKIIKTVDNKATRVIISSSRRGERSWQMAKGNMSVFTYGIVKVLTGRAGENYKERNGDISISRIISYAKYEIPHLAETEGEVRKPQNPVTKVWTKGRPSEEIILAKVNPLMPPPKSPAIYVQDRLDEWNAAQGIRRLREPNRTDALKVLWNELQNGVKSQFNAPDSIQSAREGFQAAIPVGATFFTENYDAWESRRLGTTAPQDRESKRKAWLNAIQEYFKNENLNEDDYRKLLYKAGIGPALRQVLVNGTEAQPQNSHRVSSVKGGVAVVKVVVSPASDKFDVEFTEGGGKSAYDDVVTRRRDMPPIPPGGELAGVPREYEVSLTKKTNVLNLKITDVDESGKKLEFSSHTLIIDCKANVTIDSPREKASKDTFEMAGLVWNDEGKRPNVEVYVGQEKVSKPAVYTEDSQEKVGKWKTEVNFKDKKEGNYTLEVRAVDPDNSQTIIAKSLRNIRFERTVLPLVSLPFALPPNATLKADKGNPTIEDDKRQFRLTEEMKDGTSFVVEQNGFVVWRGQLKGRAVEPVGNFGGFVARRVPEFKNVTSLQLKPMWVRKDVPYFNLSEQNPFGPDYLPVGVYDLKFDLKGLNPFTVTVPVKEETESIDIAGLLNNNKQVVEQAIQRQNVVVKASQRRGGRMEPLPDGAMVRLVSLESPVADTLKALKDDLRWAGPLLEERDKLLQGRTEGGVVPLKTVWAGKYQVWAALPGKKERMAKDGQKPEQNAIADVRAQGDAQPIEVVLFPLSATFKGFEVPPGATVKLAQALREIEEENGKRIQMVLDDEGEKGDVTVSKGKLVFWRGKLENLEIKPASGDGFVRRTYPLALKNTVKVESIKLVPVENQVPYCDISKQYPPLNFSSRTENAIRWENVPVGVYHLEVKLPGLNAIRIEGIVISETAEAAPAAREGNAGGEEAQDLVALLGNHIEEVKKAIPVCETVAVKATRKGKPLDDGATVRLALSQGAHPPAVQTFEALKQGQAVAWIEDLLKEFNAPQTGQPVQNGAATFRRVWAGQYDVMLQLKGKSPRPAKLSNKQKATLTIPAQPEVRAEVFFPQIVAVFKSIKPEMELRGLELVPAGGGAPIAIEGDKVAKTEDVDSDVLYRLQWKKTAVSPRWTPVPNKEIKISDDKEEESFDVNFERNKAKVTFKLDTHYKPENAPPCSLRPKPEPDDAGWAGAAVPVPLSGQPTEVEVGRYEVSEGWELVGEKPSDNVGRLDVYGEKDVILRRQIYSSRLNRTLPAWGAVMVETKQGTKPLVDKEGRLSKELVEDGNFDFIVRREDDQDRYKKGRVFIRHRGDETVALIVVDDKGNEMELDRIVDIVWRLPTPNTIPLEFLNVSPDIKEVEVNFTRTKPMPDGEVVRMPIKLTMKRQEQGNDFVAAGNWDSWIEICPRLKDCDKKNPRTEQCPFFVDPNDGKRHILEVNRNYYKASDKIDKGKLIITLKDSRAR